MARMLKDGTSYYDVLKKNAAEVQSRKQLAINQFMLWLSQNVNMASDYVNDSTSRKITTSGNFLAEFEVREERMFVSVRVTWSYIGTESEVPNPQAITKFVPGLTLKKTFSSNSSSDLEVEYLIDLNSWPNLVKTHLGHALVLAMFTQNLDDETKALAHTQAEQLMQYQLPYLNMELVRHAYNVGAFEDKLSLRDWLENYHPVPNMQPKYPSADLV